MNIEDRRNYLKRLKEKVEEHGIEYVLKVISMEQLQRHFICEDWKVSNESRNKVARLHRFHKTTNFCRMCGTKNVTGVE